MGEFEVSLSLKVEAEDRFDAARKVYALIGEATPTRYWVCNEGGVGDEVVVTADEEPERPDFSSNDNPVDLVEQLYRLGVSYGAGTTRTSEDAHQAEVDAIETRLITALSATVGGQP